MEHNNFELHLRGAADPDGQVSFDALARLAAPIQLLATRVGRYVADQHGAGRTEGHIERATRLRLFGLAPTGSTLLDVAYGESDALPLPDVPEDETAQRFWEVIEGIAANCRPDWATDLIADSAGSIVDALKPLVESLEFRRKDGTATTIAFTAVDPAVWQEVAPRQAAEALTVVGRLDAVDLLSARFRISDDVGNRFELRHVQDASTVAALIGHRASGTGRGERAADGSIKVLRDASVQAAPLPPAWQLPDESELQAALLGATIVDPDSFPELTQEESDAYYQAMHGV